MSARSSRKPFVFSNLATSLDGKINITGKGHFPLGTRDDWREMQRLRKKSDAIVFGASTLRGFKAACCIEEHDWPLARQPVNVVLSSKLEGLSTSWPFFKDPRIKRILLVSDEASAERVRRFQRCCEVLVLPSSTRGSSQAASILKLLEDRGLRQILVEGGGQVMWEFLKPNLIDEIHITLTPRILGGRDAPTLVEGAGFKGPEVLNFEIKSVKKLKNELYLVYQKTSARGVNPAW
jgi:riboflavin-specific deaminase-like protein